MLETEWFEGRGVADEGGDALLSVVDVVLVSLVLGLLGLSGCASSTAALPACPVAEAHLASGPGGQPLIVFDVRNFGIFRRSVEMGARGECVDTKSAPGPGPAKGTEM